MDFGSYLKTSAAEIDQEIDKLLRVWNEHVKKTSHRLLKLSELFAQHCEGGKRLRGMLVRLGYELMGTPYSPEILKSAAAFELFQTAILIHDDFIDLSSTRRGRPTLHKALGGNHYAISQAICLGDIGFFLAEKLITGSNFPEDRKNRALASFIQTMLDTALGESLDIELAHSHDISEEDILTIFRLKTARYTIVGPLHLGAILGGADEKLLKELVVLGEALGIAFQVQDDILGVFGDEKTLGKSVTSDIEEGKQTLLISYALEHAAAKQREVLKKYYGKGKIGDSELGQIREIFRQTGALQYSQKKADQLVDEAKKIIDKIEVPAGKKQLLSEMADYIIKRLK